MYKQDNVGDHYYQEGYEDGVRDAVQQATHIIDAVPFNDASPVGRALTELRDKIQREIDGYRASATTTLSSSNDSANEEVAE